METLINLFLQDLLFVVIFFLLVFAGLLYAASRERALVTLVGFARILGSLLYSPLIYLRNVLGELSDYGSKGEREFSHSRQYLLNKVFLALESLVVVVFSFLIANGIVAGWDAFIPPKELRDAINRAEDDLEKNQLTLEQLQPRIAQLDKSWAANRNALVADLQRNREKKTQQWTQENRQLGETLRDLEKFSVIRNLHQQTRWSYQKTPENYFRIFLDARRSITESVLPKDIAASLHRYNENWYRMNIITLDIGKLAEEHTRAIFQPAFATLKEEYDQLNAATLHLT